MSSDSFAEARQLTLHDGRTITLDDDDDILLHLQAEGTTHTTTFAAPSGGYGGGRLLLAPSEHYLLFAYYSGESEEGLAIFAITADGLTLFYDFGYIYGEDAHYHFSPDETTLYQTLRTGSYYADDVQHDADGAPYYQFGTITAFHIQSKTHREYPVIVYPAPHWQEEDTDEGTFAITNVTDDALHLILPWNETDIPLPLADIIRLQG